MIYEDDDESKLTQSGTDFLLSSSLTDTERRDIISVLDIAVESDPDVDSPRWPSDARSPDTPMAGSTS